MNIQQHDVLLRYREEAMMALDDGELAIQPRQRLKAMSELPSELRVLNEYREAFIATAIVGRCRAAIANKQMASLRRSRENTGEIELFESFESKLEDHLSGVSFSGHGFKDRQLDNADPEIIYAGIRKIIDVLADLGYDAFANSGTLLGLVRDEALIPYDDDIDLAVMLNSQRDDEAAQEFKALSDSLLGEGLECRVLEGNNAIIKLPNIDGFEVDLFPAYGARRGYNIYPYSRKDLILADVLPLKTCPVSGVTLPARPEVLLEKNYGPEWTTPDSRFSFPWAVQKKKFAPLLKEFSYEH